MVKIFRRTRHTYTYKLIIFIHFKNKNTMQKFQQIDIKKKPKGKTVIKLTYNENEVSRFENVWNTKKIKESDQYASAKLDDCIQKMIPHLMFGSELISTEIKLNAELDYDLWFKENHFKDDERFSAVEVTKIQFIGKEKLDSVKIFGYRETQLTDKAFKVKIETPVINLDKTSENYYALVTILEAQLSDMDYELERWLTDGETLNKAQQLALFEAVEAEQD